MKIIKAREPVEIVEHFRYFTYGDEGRGFMFRCDEQGNVLLENEASKENYRIATSRNITYTKNQEFKYVGEDEHGAKYEPIPGTGTEVTEKVYDHGILKFERHHWDDAVGICEDCGEEVVLSGFTNTCDCGADYNSSGQRLAPRSQWGEETGESLSDILGIDAHDPEDLLG